MSNYFLGIDCSTQSMKGIIINGQSLTIDIEINVNYDKDLPHFHTDNGVYISEDETQVSSNPLMWVEALDLLFEKLNNTGLLLNNIKAISGSAQQHGTVYLNNKFNYKLKELNSRLSLAAQLKGVFSRELSPVWMDSSTSEQCEEIRTALGGVESIIKLTGSNTFERFSGPQIRKFYQKNLQKYENTTSIHLVSSFLSSLLLGKQSPIDHGDGAGMNLMNIVTKQWDDKVVNTTAPNLKQKLPNLVESYSIIGNIAPYFVQRYGFSPNTKLLPWSGDNPNSLVGVGLTEPEQAAISLGTSDTYFTPMKQLVLDLSGESHVFGAPLGDYMALICFKNGSLAREAVRDYFDLSWSEFSNILKTSSAGNNGGILLPYFYPEIVPLVLQPKVYRFGFDEDDKESNIRGIIEAQSLSMRLHSRWLKSEPNEIIATGGGSENREILQVFSDVFQVPIKVLKVSDSAALGAALRSFKSYHEINEGNLQWSKTIQKLGGLHPLEILSPIEDNKDLYNDLIDLYQRYENFILQNGINPENKRIKFKQKYFK